MSDATEDKPPTPTSGPAAMSDDPPTSRSSAAPPTSGVEDVPSSDPLAQARADVDRFREQWMRAAADFDNFRKRSRREIEDAKRFGREDLLRELLPVFDNLERGIQSAQRANDTKAVADGLGMIQKQFVDTLQRAGISKVPGVGTPFDPAVHEAIQQVETKDHPPGVVLAEVQPGYVQGERLVRAAMVVVSKAPPDGGGGGPDSPPSEHSN